METVRLIYTVSFIVVNDNYDKKLIDFMCCNTTFFIFSDTHIFFRETFI